MAVPFKRNRENRKLTQPSRRSPFPAIHMQGSLGATPADPARTIVNVATTMGGRCRRDVRRHVTYQSRVTPPTIGDVLFAHAVGGTRQSTTRIRRRTTCRRTSRAQYVDIQGHERSALTAGTEYALAVSVPATAAIKISAKSAGRHMTIIAQVVGGLNGK